MAYEIKDNTATLFDNTKKEKDNQPDMRGEAMVDGIKKNIAAWKKTSKNGSEYLSLSFGEFKEQEQTAHQESKANGYQPQADEFDDQSIPF